MHFHRASLPSRMVMPERLGCVNYFLHEDIQIKPGALGGGTTAGQSLQASHQGSSVGRSLLNQCQATLQRSCIRHLLGEQLRPRQDRREDIVKIVRNARRHFSHSAQFLGVQHLLSQSTLFSHILEDDRQPGAGAVGTM